MDKITTLEKKIISDQIFNSININSNSQEYYDKLNIIETYYEKIDGNIRQFFSTISEFIPSHITSLVYPDNYQYSNTSKTNKALVEKVIGDLYMINNNIKSNISDIKNKNSKLETDLKSQETSHTKLLGEYQDKVSINNGSDVLFNESVDLYKMQYLINIFIIIGVIILIISLYQIYKNK
jgi:hypothetical protein